MLVIVCVLYTVCLTPYVVRVIVFLVIPGFRSSGRYNNTFSVVLAMMHLLAAINAAANFLVYYGMSTRYRITMAEMMGRKGNKHPRTFQTTVTSITD